MKDNQDRIGYPALVEGSPQKADIPVPAVDSSVPGADTRDIEDRVGTLGEIEAPQMDARPMSQTHARGREIGDQHLFLGEPLLVLPERSALLVSHPSCRLEA